MTSHRAFSARPPRRRLMLGASVAALAMSLAIPARAQTMGALLNAQANRPRPSASQTSATPRRSATMQAALARQQSTQSRIAQIRAYAASIRAAADRGSVADGLDPNGLDPTDTIREAIAAVRAGDSDRANQLLVSAGAANDATGLKTWQGAGLPSQTVGADGKVTVTIDQTQERALLSWNRFDIGTNTTLQFNQKENGVAQTGWVAVNRVTNATDPSRILGNLKADGTVVVLNQAGIIFGKNSQVNTHSLLASTLELGNAVRFTSGSRVSMQATTISERNAAFLESGLFGPGNGTLSQNTAVDPDGPGVLVSAQAEGNFSSASDVRFKDQIEGAVVVDNGARISSNVGGFLMLTAPRIEMAGTLTAVDGQVSLQAGRLVAFAESTGADSSIDPYVRGYKLNSLLYGAWNLAVSHVPGPADGSILVDGIIQSRRGYLSLGTSAYGRVDVNGYLEATTSVSRNGKIALLAGNVTLGGSEDQRRTGGIAILPDDNGETIPRGTAAEPAAFKSSQILIGTQVQDTARIFDGMAATDFAMGQNAVIYAPNADVRIGVSSDWGAPTYAQAFPGNVDIGRGAIIDVSGLKDVELAAARNALEITPVKRNELRDTPNYREVALDGDFTLNGATLYVDPRLSGVREDGVAWVGSPLIEAGSLAGQIPTTAAEFMTAGGSVNLQTATLLDVNALTAANAPAVHIAKDAVIDFSGGWVRYAAGTVRTSRLITADGRIVDIGQANPNDVYVGVAEGFTEVQPRFGIMRTYLNAAGQGLRYDAAYDEGRDAGSLNITSVAAAIDGSLYGNAFAGSRQIAAGDRPGRSSTLAGDIRLLQRTPYELPSGGQLAIDTLGDTIVYHGIRGGADSDRSELLLDDGMLTGAGLSALQLSASGAITFANAATDVLQSADALTLTGTSQVELAPGGALIVDAGRTTRFDGTVVAASGRIEAKTDLKGGRFNTDAVRNGSIFRRGLYGEGNGDDVSSSYLYETDPGELNPFDIVVTGTLSTAGLWVNDYAETGILRGGAFRDGGTISLTVAPNVFMAIGDNLSTAMRAVDLSGSLRISGTLNVSSGGYVDSSGRLDLSGKGGDVSLINATTYASSRLTFGDKNNPDARSDMPINGNNQSVDFTPLPATGNMWPVLPALVPTPSSIVDIGSATFLGFGFAGGGTFSLQAPDISFGSDSHAGSTHISLNFFRDTGFGTLGLTSYRSRIVDDIFTNPRDGKSAFLDTTRFEIGAGETLDLTQWVLPSILSVDQAKALRGLTTGSDLLDQSFLAPLKPAELWDQRGANLVIGGLTELDVLAGGRIIGAPEASITATKLYNAGEIVLRGGSIAQRNDSPDGLVVAGLGVRDAELGGNGLADAFGGSVDGLGRFDENAANAADVRETASPDSRLLTNGELVSRSGFDRIIYFLGRVEQGDGIVLDAGSLTDLSGIALFDPRARVLGNGSRIRTGRVVAGGSLRLNAGVLVSRPVGNSPGVLREDRLIRDDAARLDISGSSAFYDMANRLGSYVPYQEWSGAGTISALGGGTLGSTPIAARGGVAAAQGGTLEWLQPTIGDSNGTALDYLSAALIAESGFDSMIARGGLELDGDFTLSLRKSLQVTSRDPVKAGDPFGLDAYVTVTATDDTDATLQAGYIRFASRIGRLPLISTSADEANVAFVAGAQGMDVVGGIGFQASIASLTLATSGDLRFTGVNERNPGTPPTYDGQLVAGGDLLLDARRIYATTGTGNYQGLLEGLPEAQRRPYDIAVAGDHSITFGNSFIDSAAPAPLSAGTHLRVLAPRIVQNGYLAAPLGLLELGSTSQQFAGGSVNPIAATTSLIFGPGSVTTVSASGMNLPYGTTTDQIEYYFPTITTPITKLPTGELRLAAVSIVQEEGARFDGRGGGDVYGYEFQPGVGGSRDVLDRINRDLFSSNDFDPLSGNGYQYSDHRQVFALVPVSQADKVAPYDPIYSADYGSAGPVDLYGANAGLTVTLDGAPGVPAGEYLLVPAKYAMAIPGALRLVENTGANAPIPGQSTRLLDGSIVVGGTYGYTGTGIAESTRRSFLVQTKDTFTKYSTIRTTSGSDYLLGQNGSARPRLPLDAARVVLSPLTELKIAGVFDTRPAEGGQGGQFDLLGSNIVIAADDGEQASGVLTISTSTLAGLDATSLLIGGQRSDSAVGTTAINATARSILVKGGATLDVPELLLAVGGAGSTLSIEDGATLAATGDLGTQAANDYTASTAGSILRLASGGERMIRRSGTGSSSLSVGAATLKGGSLALDTSGTFAVADAAALSVERVAISGGSIQFDDSEAVAGQAGVIGAALEAKLAAAQRLTVRSPGAIRFSAGEHGFNDLVLDTASLAAGARDAASDSVTVKARDVQLVNSTAAADGCAAAGFCGDASQLTIDATTIAFGVNAVHASGFADAVVLTGRDGLYVEGKGSFSSGQAALTLNAPFLTERAASADPREQAVRPDYNFLTEGAFLLSSAGTNPAATPGGNAAPGARIGIGTGDARVASVRIEGSLIRATAGIVDIQSEGDVLLAGAAIETPGYQATFGDKDDPVTVSAGGGVINLMTAQGNIVTDAASRLVVDSGVGAAGALNLLAGNGAITLEAALNPNAQGSRSASLAFDSGRSAFDLSGFVARYGQRFGGDIAIRSGAGDLILGEGLGLKAESVSLTAEGGAVAIAGTIDTSGVDVTGMSDDAARNARVNGGDIALWGAEGVTLASTAMLDAHTSGYADRDSRIASAGNVSLGIGTENAALTIAAGAIIDVGARRTQSALANGDTGARLIPETITNATTGQLVTVYRYVEPDKGGTVNLRAPVLGADENKVAVSVGGSILGAGSIELEGFRRYDLDVLLASGQYSGISASADGVVLNMAQNSASTGRYNPFTEDFALEDGSSSMVRFIREFDVSAVDGSSLAGIRLRPGVELISSGGISTETQWNLAAASFSDTQLQAAVAAGDLVASGSNAGRYSVVSGREGHLLENFANFLYRVGGSARGEAAVVTMRAGGDLTINRSISDGFFAFRSGAGSGAAVLITDGAVAGSASADPLGSAALFPLLADGSAIHSSDLRLVAGAAALLSVDPLHVDAARAADVTVTGEYSFGPAGTVPVRSYVRSGDGDIDVAAARDIDIRGSNAPEYRRRSNGAVVTRPNYNATETLWAGQFGAAAIYTAGTRVAQAAVSARIIGGGAQMSIMPDSPYLAPSIDPAALLLADNGGDVLLEAGRDVLSQRETFDDSSSRQLWRTGSVGTDTEIGMTPGKFVSGVGALAGGSVTVLAGRDVRDLSIALDSGVTTSIVDDSKVMLTFGSGDLTVAAGRDILSGRYDISSGAVDIHADRDIAAYGTEPMPSGQDAPAYLRIRLSDAVVDISARGKADLASVSALGVFTQSAVILTRLGTYQNRDAAENEAASGFFSPTAALNLQANESASILGTLSPYPIAYGIQAAFNPPSPPSINSPAESLQVLPPSLGMTSISGSTVLRADFRHILYPSPIGQLRLLSQGDIGDLSLAMSDVDPGLLGGAFSLSQQAVPYRFPVVLPGTTSAELRYQHNQNPTHADDAEPVRIYTNGDFEESALFLPKQARVTAGGDIVDLFFQGQNLLASDITRIRANGDIRGTIGGQILPAVISNNFILGGPGTFIVEAGEDLGPFMTSANIRSGAINETGILYSYGGGIRTVGNDLNPWLDRAGADLNVRFGMTEGADYAALRETYLNPDNFAQLDGDLFEQVTDSFGNARPDRDRPVYAPALARWLRDNAPGQFAAIFGQAFPDTEAGNAALAQAAYGKASQLYTAFAAIDPLRQQDFLVNDLLFGEIGAVGTKNGPSFQQYIRGYRAIQTLFPTSLGYTDNLAPYTLDPATVSPDHPLGEPVRNIVNGEPQPAVRVETGSLDLRLATIQTGRGGDVTILGPGGDLIAGSVIRTADQPGRHQTTFAIAQPARSPGIISGSILPTIYSNIESIPLGYEGVLTLEGGQIRTITDGDVQLNQSRVFTQRNGDITMWSSNGDLAAGQGPKSASTFPPITVRFDEDGSSEVDSMGSVSGAGIGSFKRTPEDPPSDVILIAPVGTVDAGDAGVRASGNIVVAAARVANADNFKAAGDITGVAIQPAAPVAVTTNASNEIQAQLQAVNQSRRPADPRSLITVNVLGAASDGVCQPGGTDDPDCTGN